MSTVVCMWFFSLMSHKAINKVCICLQCAVELELFLQCDRQLCSTSLRVAPALALEGPALCLLQPHSSPIGEGTTGLRRQSCRWVQASLSWGFWGPGSSTLCLLDNVLNTQDPKFSTESVPRACAGFFPSSVLPQEDHTAVICTPRPEEPAKRSDCAEGGQSLGMCARVSTLFPQSPFDIRRHWSL